MTAVEAYELTTRGGATDFEEVIAACEVLGPYCLIGGLAVNCFVEPVYTLDADLVVIADNLGALSHLLEQRGFRIDRHPHSVNATAPNSDLRIQLTTDERYQSFLLRADIREVFGLPVRVACLRDVTQGKLWAYGDPKRRLSKRKKDELDLVRLAEAYPELLPLYPDELRSLIDG